MSIKQRGTQLTVRLTIMVAKAINMTTIAGVFPAGGDSKFGLICDTITMWAFAVPAGFLAAFYPKLPVVVVFLIINLDEVVNVLAVILNYKKMAG